MLAQGNDAVEVGVVPVSEVEAETDGSLRKRLSYGLQTAVMLAAGLFSDCAMVFLFFFMCARLVLQRKHF